MAARSNEDRCRAIAVVALLVSCHAWAGRKAVLTDGEAATTGGRHHTRLSKNKTDCLLFETADHGRHFLVRVRENHMEACGGEPGFSPALTVAWPQPVRPLARVQQAGAVCLQQPWPPDETNWPTRFLFRSQAVFR